jgi:SAM-dependent methyltransferase
LAKEVARRACLLTRLAARPPGKLLDVGCGNGQFLDAAKRLGWKTVGSEIAYAAANVVSAMHLRLVGELEALRARPHFDAVTFWDVLEHLPDPARALRRAWAVLHVGGLVAVTMPNVVGTGSLFAGTQWPYYDFTAYGHIHHLAPKHIRMVLKSAGFEPILEETRGSVDLRDLPTMFGLAPPSASALWLLDKTSGLIARVAEHVGLGNTLLVIARKTRHNPNGARAVVCE